MKFTKYNSIENSYRQKFIDKILSEDKADGRWVVTEKIHGSNFSFWHDGEEMRMAKRKSFIADDENFFGIQNLKDELIKKVKRLYSLISPKEYLAVFGELYGGAYPHPEVLRHSEAKKVQKGVYYCPLNDLKVYDIKVDGLFIDFLDMINRCFEAGLNYVEPIFFGSFKECLEYKNDFSSQIYIEYCLPKIEDNICEGIVIRPLETRFLYDRSRVMLKSKNERFADKKSEPKVKREKIELSKDEELILNRFLETITDGRYDSVVSKIGDVSAKDFGKLQGEVMKDIVEELKKETTFWMNYNNLEKQVRKRINKVVGKKLSGLIRKRLIEES